MLGLAMGAVLGVGRYTFIYAKGYSYMTNNAAACANCHVMQEYYDGWLKSSHRSVTVCNDCHTPPGFVAKYMTKASNGFWHSFYFTTGNYPELMRITRRNHEVTEQACRKWPEEELKTRVETIQERTFRMRNLAMDALIELIDDIKRARESGKTDAELAAARDYQRRAQFYLDFVEAENFTGFHAGQEAVRILGESINFSRQGQVALRDGRAAPPSQQPGARPSPATPSPSPAKTASLAVPSHARPWSISYSFFSMA